MALHEKDELTIRADRLARAAGPLWSEFLAAMGAMSAKRSKECVQAPQDKVIVAQGRAQECAYLLDLFTNAKVDAEKLQQRTSKQET